YRKPIDFTDESIASAQNSWETLKEGLLFGHRFGDRFDQTPSWSDWQDASFGQPESMRIDPESESVKRFRQAMDDDINSPGALAVLFELAKDLRREGNILTHSGATETDPASLRQQWQTLVVLAQVLGLEAKPEAEPEPSGISEAEIESLIQQRRTAKQAKNFAESDRIRDQLKAAGVVLIDKPGGVIEWHRG
ncbi:MAG: DALR domain-containing protein, partial [Elainella sp.]